MRNKQAILLVILGVVILLMLLAFCDRPEDNQIHPKHPYQQRDSTIYYREPPDNRQPIVINYPDPLLNSPYYGAR